MNLLQIFYSVLLASTLWNACIASSRVAHHNQQRCYQPKEVGRCRAYYRRWYYNKHTQSCQIFHYGGCNGNGNRFISKSDCEASCPTTAAQSFCALPRVQGPCRKYYTRYHYNTNSKHCEPFIYGGCQGNANNFESMNACEKKCGQPCMQPLKQGPCLAHMPRYYFNIFTQECQRFIWGGCSPNSNNFQTKKDCVSTCQAPCRNGKNTKKCHSESPRFGGIGPIHSRPPFAHRIHGVQPTA